MDNWSYCQKIWETKIVYVKNKQNFNILFHNPFAYAKCTRVLAKF